MQISEFIKARENSNSKILLPVPSVKILGDKEMYVKAGTAVTLRCLISNCLEEPAYVFWYHGDRRLLDDQDQIPGDLVSDSELTTSSSTPTVTVSSKKKKLKLNLKPIYEEDLDKVFSRGGITIRTQRLVSDGSAISFVTIKDPTPAHSGPYACRPANLEPAYVNLHVIQGELTII